MSEWSDTLVDITMRSMHNQQLWVAVHRMAMGRQQEARDTASRTLVASYKLCSVDRGATIA